MKNTDFNQILKDIELRISKLQKEINENDKVKISSEEKLDELTQLADFLRKKIEGKNEVIEVEIDSDQIKENKSFLSKFLSRNAKSRYNVRGLGDDKWGLSIFGYVVWEEGIRKSDEERFHRLERVVLPSLGLKETYKRLKKLKDRAPTMFGKDCWQAEAAYDSDLDKLKLEHYDKKPEKYDFIWK